MDCSPPGSSIHGISQARILEWVAISSLGRLPDPGIEPKSPALQADSLLLREISPKNPESLGGLASWSSGYDEFAFQRRVAGSIPGGAKTTPLTPWPSGKT